ncbi:Retrovirus-related Pol polyprotein from transposon 17.6 [Sesbania bispinosa]|nr:Retrovirus-related Pol polyprotein from transposon 17.6 [Sesbania bispinosa]
MAIMVDSDPLNVNASFVDTVEINVVGAEPAMDSKTAIDIAIEEFEKEENADTSLCPRCKVVFDEVMAKSFESLEIKKHYQQTINQRNQKATSPVSNFEIRRPPFQKKYEVKRGQTPKFQKPKSYVPPSNVPPNKWIRVTDSQEYRQNPQLIQVQGASSQPTYSQILQKDKVNVAPKSKVLVEEDLFTDDFETGFPDRIEDICGVVSILPAEFEKEYEEGFEDDFIEDESSEPQTYYTCLST